MANIAAPSRNIVRLAPVSVREAKMRSGMSGALASRPSISRNTPISASPAAIVTCVAAEPQPCTSVSTIP